MCICRIVNLGIYYGLQLNISNMGGNDFVNFFYLSAIELPSNLAGYVLAEKWGRRWTHSAFLGLTAVTTLLAALCSQCKYDSPSCQ